MKDSVKPEETGVETEIKFLSPVSLNDCRRILPEAGCNHAEF